MYCCHDHYRYIPRSDIFTAPALFMRLRLNSRLLPLWSQPLARCGPIASMTPLSCAANGESRREGSEEQRRWEATGGRSSIIGIKEKARCGEAPDGMQPTNGSVQPVRRPWRSLSPEGTHILPPARRIAPASPGRPIGTPRSPDPAGRSSLGPCRPPRWPGSPCRSPADRPRARQHHPAPSPRNGIVGSATASPDASHRVANRPNL
jgi:hypothetical protein